jgi:hypothetical protein
VSCSASCLWSPQSLHREHISDHAPVVAILKPKHQLGVASQPVSKELFKIPALKVYHDAYVQAAKPAPTFKYAIGSKCASIARAVWHNDRRLASILIAHSALPRTHILCHAEWGFAGRPTCLHRLRFRPQAQRGRSQLPRAQRLWRYAFPRRQAPPQCSSSSPPPLVAVRQATCGCRHRSSTWW